MYKVGLRIALQAAIVTLLAGAAAAQGPGARPVRELIAVGRVGNLADAPMHFRMVRVDLQPGTNASFSGPASMVYGLSGTLACGTQDAARSILPGEGAFLEPGSKVTFTAAGSERAIFMHILLGIPGELDKQSEGRAVANTELHRWAIPSAARRPGPHEFGLTRVTVAPRAPGPPLHQRSGAALYYVLAGTGALNMADGKVEPRPAGAIQEEPFGFIHTWSNPGDAQLILLQANISAEGMPEILFVK